MNENYRDDREIAIKIVFCFLKCLCKSMFDKTSNRVLTNCDSISI